MNDRTIAAGIAAGRIALGAGLLARPTELATGWVGIRDARRAGARVFARGLGARDVAMGVGTLAAARAGRDLRPLLVAGAAVDLADGLATVADRKSLPRLGLAGVGGLALGAAALEAGLAGRRRAV